ncbi:MAG: hypothetical protein IKN41_08495 [Candidatus Methanomethylophilaceae archaeon]|nr:hypothetical protein [Candidatus Methanomethylophilaceae archaeon]
MMEDCPVKFRILELLEENNMRTEKIVSTICKERKGYDNDYGKAMIKYDVIELVSAGLVNENESVVDEAGEFQKGKLLTDYSITELGHTYLDELKTKVRS